MARRFTWWEAERELPRLAALLREAVDLNREYRKAERAVQQIGTRIMLMGGVAVDRPAAVAARQEYEGLAGRLKQAIAAIQESGCVVKDLDAGLLDFPTLFRGREVFLCWKAGEPSIGFWHGIEEGFAGRKPIDDDFLKNHRSE